MSLRAILDFSPAFGSPAEGTRSLAACSPHVSDEPSPRPNTVLVLGGLFVGLFEAQDSSGTEMQVLEVRCFLPRCSAGDRFACEFLFKSSRVLDWPGRA